MRYLVLFLSLFIVGCVSYYPSSYRVESVLAVTSKGDTIQMPLSQIRKQYSYDTYSNWQFYYENNWWRWNNWPYRYYSPYYNWNRYTYVPRSNYTRPQTQPKVRPRPRVNQPRPQPRPRVNPSRTQTTPNVQTRTNVGRSSNGVKQKQ